MSNDNRCAVSRSISLIAAIEGVILRLIDVQFSFDF
jgi:hypothetical protein